MKRKLLTAILVAPLTILAMHLQAQTLTTTESRCVNTGTVIINGVVGAGSPYQVSIVSAPPDYINPGTQLIAGLPDTLEALYPGAYTLRVIDKNGVPFDSPFSIVGNYILPDNGDYNPTATAVTNCAAPNGSIQGILSNGRAPYNYTIISGPAQVGTTNTTGTFANLPAGSYLIQAGDSCQNIQTRAVSIAASASNVTLSNAVITKVSCNSFSLDALTVSPGFPAGGHYEVINTLGDGSTVLAGTGTSLPIPFNLVNTNDIESGLVKIVVYDACGSTATIQPQTIANAWDFTAADITISCASGTVLNGVTTTGPITAPFTTTITPFDPNNGPVAGAYTPAQMVTGYPYSVSGIDPTVALLSTVTTITDACGLSKSVTNELTFNIVAQLHYKGCDSITANFTPIRAFTPPITYTAYLSDYITQVASNSTGTFTLPDGFYSFTGTDACGKTTGTGLLGGYHGWQSTIIGAPDCALGGTRHLISVPGKSIGAVTFTQYSGAAPITASSTILSTQTYTDARNGMPSTDTSGAISYMYFNNTLPNQTYTYVVIDSCGTSDTVSFINGAGHQQIIHSTTIVNKCINKGDLYGSWKGERTGSANYMGIAVWEINTPNTPLRAGWNDIEANNSLLLSDIPLGTYVVKYSLIDCNDSANLVYDTVVVKPYVQPRVLTAQSFPPCAGGGNPVIVRAVEGVGPYMYEVINSTPSNYTVAPQTSPVFVLPTYQSTLTVRVLDACSNSSTRTVSITRASSPIVRSSTAAFTACSLPLNYSLSIDSLYIGSQFEWTKLTGTGAGSTIIGTGPSLPLTFNSIADTATYQVRLTVPGTCFETISKFSVPDVVVTCLPSISGTVLDDADGLTDSTVNGTGTNAGGLNAVLVNSSNQVVAIVPVNANGTYSFLNVAAATYSVVITTNTAVAGDPAPAVLLPAGWISTGENLGNGTGSDGLINATLLNIVVNATDVSDVNFGIEQLPLANDTTIAAEINPGASVQVTVPALTGSDAEDGIYDGVGGINTIVIVTLPVNGILYYNGLPVQAGDTIRNYNPAALTIDPSDGTTTVVFTFQEIDAALQSSNIATVTMPFTNTLPLADADTATTLANIPVTVPVLPNDTFGNDGPSTGTITVTDTPSNGTVVINDNGTPTDPTDDQIVYTPNTNFTGTDTLIYQICDSNGDCDTAQVVITILPVNDFPVALADTATTIRNTPVTVPVLPGDTFGNDGPSTGTITVTQNPTNGTVVVNDNGTPTDPTDDYIFYTPNTNYTGTDTLIYQICDSNGDCDTAQVVITILSTVPVTLTSFDAHALNNAVALQWKVAQELATSRYEVEFSTDSKNFSSVGTIAASGKSLYEMQHLYPVNGNNFYRLKMIDNNGAFSYSNIVMVRFSNSGFAQVSIAPNPFGSNVNLKFTLAKASACTVKIYEGAGQLVYDNKYSSLAGSNSILITNLNGLAKGLYTIVITTDEFTEVRKLLKR